MSELDFGNIAIAFVAFLFSICFHEYAHAWMAQRKGDETARLMGRLTMNPVAHADLVGTIILPLVAMMGTPLFFGWAKPVPVNPRNLRDVKNDMFWVALAGPASNLLLAFVGAFGIVLAYRFHVQENVVFTFLRYFLMFNLVLCFFNLIPLHPLDGGKILARFLPEELNRKLEEMQHYSMIILVVLFVTGILKYIQYPIEITGHLLLRLAESFIP